MYKRLLKQWLTNCARIMSSICHLILNATVAQGALLFMVLMVCQNNLVPAIVVAPQHNNELCTAFSSGRQVFSRSKYNLTNLIFNTDKKTCWQTCARDYIVYLSLLHDQLIEGSVMTTVTSEWTQEQTLLTQFMCIRWQHYSCLYAFSENQPYKLWKILFQSSLTEYFLNNTIFF